MNEYKLLTILILIGIIIVSVSYFNSLKPKPIDCSKPLDVVYLSPSELKYASEIANKINGVVVIPGMNQVLARTEILNCASFDYSNYLSLDGGDSLTSSIPSGNVNELIN